MCKSLRLLLILLVAAGLPGCAGSKKAATPPPIALVENLDATGDDYVFYSLKAQKEVAAGEDWDVAFQGTNIRVHGAAQVIDQPFDQVTEAPREGYRPDTDAATAIPTGSGQGWYLYDSSNHTITPVADRTIIIRTADGAYAKMEILDFYLPGLNEPRFYTFRYAYQSAGPRPL